MNQQFRMVKQMIDLQRASSDGMINTLIMMWEQTGTLLEGAALNRLPIIVYERVSDRT